jgi:gamma-tubulin complex component 2
LFNLVNFSDIKKKLAKGVEGKLIKTATLIDKHADRTFHVARIDSALRDLTKRILPICTNYSLIIRFVEGKNR